MGGGRGRGRSITREEDLICQCPYFRKIVVGEGVLVSVLVVR